MRKLAIAHSLYSAYYVILRRRLNGNIYNTGGGASEAIGTWNLARKTQCAVILTSREGDYHTEDFPAGCDEGVWDAFYFGRIGDEISMGDRLLFTEKFINGSVTAAEASMLAVGWGVNKTIYSILRFAANAYVWNNTGEALEEPGTWNNARKQDCTIVLDDKEGGYYTKQFPTACTTAGTYHAFHYEKQGDDIDISDRLTGRSKIIWYGAESEGEITPTGNRGKAMLNLRDLVAATSSFQEWAGAEDSEEAKGNLHVTAYEPPMDEQENPQFVRPFGLVCRTENDKDENIAVGENTVGGDLELRFEDDIPAEYKDNPENAELEFLNRVEAVLAEMWQLSRQPGYFAMNSVDCIEGPTQIEYGSGKYNNAIRLQVNWGLTS